MERDEAKQTIGKWLSEASDEIETDRLEAMLREAYAQVRTGIGGARTYEHLIDALQTEIGGRNRGLLSAAK